MNTTSNGAHKSNGIGTITVKASESRKAPLVRLESFVQQRAKGGYRFELYLLGEGGARTKIDTLSGSDAHDLAQRAFALAGDDGAQHRGTSAYELAALTGDGEREGRCLFHVEGSGVEGAKLAESGTPGSMVVQMVRSLEHREHLAGNFALSCLDDKTKTIEMLMRLNEVQAKTIERLSETHAEAITKRDEASRQLAALDYDREKDKAKSARIDKYGEKFFEMALPILKLRFAGMLGAAATGPTAAPAAPAAVAAAAAAPAPPSTSTAAAAPTPASEVAAAPPAPASRVLSAEECAAVVDFLSSLDHPTMLKVIGVLDDVQGAKLLALASALQGK